MFNIARLETTLCEIFVKYQRKLDEYEFNMTLINSMVTLLIITINKWSFKHYLHTHQAHYFGENIPILYYAMTLSTNA